MTEMELNESSGPSVMLTPSSSETTPGNQKPMHSVEIPAGDDNDVISNDYSPDRKLSMNASINTTESTLPMSISDESLNSSHYDIGSPMSKHMKTPQQQQELPLSCSSHTLNSTSTCQTINSQTPEKPLSKAQSIRDKRRMMEAWHDEQKSKTKSVRSQASFSSTSTISEHQPFSPFSSAKRKKLMTLGSSSRKNLVLGSNNKNKRKGTKDEMARYSRMVDRILYAEKQARNRIRSLSRNHDNKDPRERTLAMRERAELKLRLSQMEKARSFYEGLMASNSMEAIPMEILKTINDLPNYQPMAHMSLADELDAYVKTIKKEDPEEAGYMFQEIRDWKDSEDFALSVGATAPDFVLVDSNSGQTFDSKLLRQQWLRLILVFYHDYESEMCKMNLIALQKLKKTFEGEGAKLIAIGFEADTRDTADETEVTFPLLADEVGILATKFGIIRGEEFPILSTFIVDNDGTILWRYVNKDYTKRPEPMDILEALPEKSKRERNLTKRSFFRKATSFKKK